jgi:hypothetical protein
MSENIEVFVLTCEQPYARANDVVVLGVDLGSPKRCIPAVNRYLLAGLEMAGRSTDEALWRVQPDALQKLLRTLYRTYDVYGYQFKGSSTRLPELWQNKLLYLERFSVPHTLGRVQGMRALDRYVMRLEPEDFPAFVLSDGEEVWFRFLLLKPKGEAFTKVEFCELNDVYAQDLNNWGATYLDPAHMAPFLEQTFAAMVWYAYSPRGRDADGPHIGICTRKRWKHLLKRLFRPTKSIVNVYLEFEVDASGREYCLDVARRQVEQ